MRAIFNFVRVNDTNERKETTMKTNREVLENHFSKTTTIQDLCRAMNRLVDLGDTKAAAAIAAVIASQTKA